MIMTAAVTFNMLTPILLFQVGMLDHSQFPLKATLQVPSMYFLSQPSAHSHIPIALSANQSNMCVCIAARPTLGSVSTKNLSTIQICTDSSWYPNIGSARSIPVLSFPASLLSVISRGYASLKAYLATCMCMMGSYTHKELLTP